MFVHRFLITSTKKFTLAKKPIKVPKKIILSNEFSTTTNYLNNFKDNSSDHMNVSLFNIRKSLKLANTEFEDGFTNLKVSCPVCECKSTKSKTDDVYINKTTGNFICPSCRYGGKFGLIDKFFTTSRSQKTISELKTYQKLFNAAKEQYQRDNDFNYKDFEENYELVTTENVEKVFKYFEIDEKISSSSIIQLQSRYNETKHELLIPLLDILGQVVGCKLITKNESDDYSFKEHCIPDNNCSGLIIHHNGKSISTNKSSSREPSPQKAIIVLNILDLLALMQSKINATFICLPYGLKFLPQECLPLLDKYQEIVLWFNYNTAGWDVARNFAKKLDEKRCNFVRPTSLHPTPYKALVNSIDIKSILKLSQPILHKAITTFSALRQDVLSDLQNVDKVQGVKWKRYPSLNKYLKGHRKGELTILTGPTGCGKTTFMSEYSLDLAMQGVNTLWGSFEIRNTRLATTLLRQFSGKQLLETSTDENLMEFESWANQFEALPIYFMTFHGEQQIKIVMEAIEHAAYVHDINHVIIDNVQFMMGISDEAKHIDRFWKQDAIIASFRSFATRTNVHVSLVIHPRKEKDSDDLTTSSIFGGAKATQEADNVLIIQDKRLTAVRGKKYLQIAKNRYSGDLGIMPLDFDKISLSYAQKAKSRPEIPKLPTNTTEESL